MGRGLSQLQLLILYLALEKRLVTCKELLAELWGLQPRKGRSKEATYGSAYAVLSRSLKRLWSRGLIIYWFSHYGMAISLSELGKNVAETITLNEVENG